MAEISEMEDNTQALTRRDEDCKARPPEDKAQDAKVMGLAREDEEDIKGKAKQYEKGARDSQEDHPRSVAVRDAPAHELGVCFAFQVGLCY